MRRSSGCRRRRQSIVVRTVIRVGAAEHSSRRLPRRAGEHGGEGWHRHVGRGGNGGEVTRRWMELGEAVVEKATEVAVAEQDARRGLRDFSLGPLSAGGGKPASRRPGCGSAPQWLGSPLRATGQTPETRSHSPVRGAIPAGARSFSLSLTVREHRLDALGGMSCLRFVECGCGAQGEAACCVRAKLVM